MWENAAVEGNIKQSFQIRSDAELAQNHKKWIERMADVNAKLFINISKLRKWEFKFFLFSSVVMAWKPTMAWLHMPGD